MVVVFKHEGSRTTAGNQSVAILVERTARLRGFIHTDGEGVEGIERRHRVVVRLLRTATEHHILQSLTDEHHTQSDGVAAAGTGGADGEVHTTQMEDGAEVHIHGRVHRLEDESVAQHRRIVLLVHNLRRLDDGLGRRVVTKDTAHLVLTQVVVCDACLFEGLARGHIGILRLLRHTGTGMTVEHLLRDDRCFHLTHQPAAIAVAQTVLIEHDARLALIE